MPTTRRRRPRVPITLPLSSALVDVLLTGDSEADPFLVFEVDLLEGGDYLPRIYRENREALDAEWLRRGLSGQPWVLRSGWRPLRTPGGR
jgi:hypothetical protein